MHVLTHYTALAACQPQAQVLDDGQLLVVDSGLASDTFNVITCACLSASQASTRIKKAIQMFGNRPFSWWVGPQDQPAGLPELLVAEGLVHAEDETAMATDLTESTQVSSEPTTLHIRRVVNEEDLFGYAQVIAANWTPPDPEVKRFYGNAVNEVLRPASPVVLLIGCLEDQVVATAELCLSTDGTAGLYNVATRVEFRGRGIGSALTRRALRVAKAQGMHHVELQASKDGLSIYRRLGFVDVGQWREFKPSLGR
ncbi:GNAT family N-acetyltransferase [Deinococcus hopiensis]|uniref:Predicted acetyltransferase n=1 Tax=Deinococcus hopiensis KR-140 TaxID=695939 RepID=A0A1W1VVL9_9DEIO|nr:GNAT family N-acetyltransferase [Deinococcus hopiensis]SMB97422.1 Predicted acetyltransferase [Deinococcus hopiensis KR-140]